MGRVLLGMAVAALVALVRGVPTITTETYYNFGPDFCFSYSATDGLDGRDQVRAATATSPDEIIISSVSHDDVDYQHGNDWIGLYPKDACNFGEGKHQCPLATRSVPKGWRAAGQWNGTICFAQKEYKRSGEFDIRYFYGDDPQTDVNCSNPEFMGQPADPANYYTSSVPNVGCASPHFTWDGSGYVCNTAAGLEGYVHLLPDADACSCDETNSNATLAEECRHNKAACQRCALDAAASETIHVMTPFTYNANKVQASIAQISGFEFLVN